MAEISSLLGLITDDNTRQALIAQMENMFDNAPDEERLIQEIGNPTKVAVALIRYADSGKITPAAAPVVAPEQVQPEHQHRHLQHPRATARARRVEHQQDRKILRPATLRKRSPDRNGRLTRNIGSPLYRGAVRHEGDAVVEPSLLG